MYKGSHYAYMSASGRLDPIEVEGLDEADVLLYCCGVDNDSDSTMCHPQRLDQ
jgi:hypothetical protein